MNCVITCCVMESAMHSLRGKEQSEKRVQARMESVGRGIDRWRGKVALVTGAASGIGAAITKALLENGLTVVAVDVDSEGLNRMREQLRADDLHPIECDLCKEEDLNKVFEYVKCNLGGLNVLVNNAGVTDYRKIIESDRAVFAKLLNINVLAVATCVSMAVRMMRESNAEGHVFNINSLLGHEIPEGVLDDVDGSNGWNLYPSCKHATVAMTHTVRRELAKIKVPIRVTSISPGLVRTNISAHAPSLKKFFDKLECLEPEDVADGVVYALGTRSKVQITELTIRLTGEL